MSTPRLRKVDLYILEGELPAGPPAPPAPPPPAPPPAGAVTHGPDFAAVNWGGRVFTFAPKQRSVVAALFRAREDGHGWVGQDALLEIADSDCHRLRDLFRGHPAFGTLIVGAVEAGGPPGAYRLAEPAAA